MRVPVSMLLLTAAILLHGGDAWQDAFPFRIAAAPPHPPWATSTVVISLQFESGMPSDLQIVRLARRDAARAWHLAETVRTTTSGGRATVRGPIGVETLLLISAAGQPGYILDGPFRWPSRASTYMVRSHWRKTVRGSFAGVRGPLEWVSADESSLPAATCEWTDGPNWECVGIPLNAAGVVVMATTGEVKCGVPSGTVSSSGVDTASTRTAPWGRLVIAQTGLSPPAGAVHMSVRRSGTLQPRPLSTRLDVRTDVRVQVDTIADGIAWISGVVEVQEDDGWVEIEARGRARERVELRELAGAPPDVPLRVQLQPPASLSGFVKSASGAAASGTALTLYRFAADDRDDRKVQELRLVVAETTADASGSFHFDDLSVEPYEIVALHPVFGHGVRRVTPDGREIEIALQSSAQAVGRVVRDGVPAEGVRVLVVPDLLQFASAADVSELRGAEVESDRYGRFTVFLPSRGSSELRVGNENGPVRRVPLEPATTQEGRIDVGDVELTEGASVTFVLEGGSPCNILLTGPVGRTGTSVVRSARIGPLLSQATVPDPGRWHIAASCGSRERAVLPAWVDLSPAARDVTVRLVWRR